MGIAQDQLVSLMTTCHQAHRVILASSKLRELFNTLKRVNSEIDALKNQGTLDEMPTELKQALNAVWTEFKNCQVAIEALPNFDVLAV